MKSITIHKVEDPIVELIKQRADAEGISVNRVVKKLLEEALGSSHPSRHAMLRNSGNFWVVGLTRTLTLSNRPRRIWEK